jgi:hypothetical protein
MLRSLPRVRGRVGEGAGLPNHPHPGPPPCGGGDVCAAHEGGRRTCLSDVGGGKDIPHSRLRGRGSNKRHEGEWEARRHEGEWVCSSEQEETCAGGQQHPLPRVRGRANTPSPDWGRGGGGPPEHPNQLHPMLFLRTGEDANASSVGEAESTSPVLMTQPHQRD